MKHIITLFSLAPMLAFGQSLVTQSPQNRIAYVEDFKGVNCGYCPDGDVILTNIESAIPDQLVVIGIHAGIYAVPGAGQPDFRTPEGTAIDAFFPITGYPNGVINRHTFSGGLALGRGAWEAAVNEIIAVPSPVNVGVSSTFDPITRDLLVDVEMYYTANSPAGNDYISVLIKESNIIGPQIDYTNGNHTNYNHMHVLRGYFTPVWGDDLGSNPTAGTTITRQYTYNVPASWNIANCEVVAFASEYQSEIYQAKDVAADGGSTLVTGTLQTTAQENYVAGQNGSMLNLGNDLENLLGADEDYSIELTSANAPSDWTGEYLVNGTTYSTASTFTVTAGSTLPIEVQITPGGTASIADYQLTVTSMTHPGAPLLVQDYHVISGVTDLVVENLGADQWTPIYTAGLTAASQLGRGNTTRSIFTNFGEANALAGVLNLYYNVSWTFPGLVNETVMVLQDFMDNGGNLMVCGQDIGWDNSGAANSNGTPVTQAFYQNYMLATYLADGSTANSQINFIGTDAVFGSVAGSTINSVFQANSYPEEIAPIAPAVSIMTYNTPSKVGAIRGETTNFKLVYFGIGMEQVTNSNVAETIVKLSHDWFYGVVSVEEFDAAMAALGQAYPVPADQQVTIPFNDLQGVSTLRVITTTGKLIAEHQVATGVQNFILDTRDLAAGIYSYQLITQDGSMATRSLSVVH